MTTMKRYWVDDIMETEQGNNSILISLISNLFLVFFKGITGLLANSNALVADAIHSMTDVTAFFINYRACKNCELCSMTDEKGTNEKDSQRIVEIETKATYYTGIFLLTVGMTVYFYNSTILLLGRSKRPEPITVVVAFVVLAVYAGLYKYIQSAENEAATPCVLTSRNTNWQNKLNMVSGSVVLIGLIASMLGFYFMDELAAIIVGGILVGLGAKWITETKEELGPAINRHSTSRIISCTLASVVLAAICLSIRL
jgi:divalent metal cation (Fe/Co/Zn/Cd) transporter